MRRCAACKTSPKAAVNFRVAVTDHELDRLSLAVQVHQQTAGPLSHPHAGPLRRDAENTDAPADVLNHRKDIDSRSAGKSAVKKSVARMATVWERRNRNWRHAGPGPAFFIVSRTAGEAMRMPRPASSP